MKDKLLDLLENVIAYTAILAPVAAFICILFVAWTEAHTWHPATVPCPCSASAQESEK